MESKLSISADQFTDKGRKQQNEDSCGIVVPKGSALMAKGVAAVIADGVSSSSGGREASESCVQGFLTDYYSTPDSWTVKTAGQKIIGALNRWLHGRGHSYYGHAHGMLTTLSALIIKSTTAHIFHVGDTRVYHFRNGELECLTRDHQTWGDRGRNLLSRAIGADVGIDIDYRSIPTEANDIFLLTTDGVHGFIDDATLRDLLKTTNPADDAIAKAIADLAVTNGSDDNITCQVIKIKHLDDKNDEEFYRELTALPFPPPLDDGMILDGYRVIKEIHANRRTQIYLVEDVATLQKFVLKTPSVNFEDDPLYIEQFIYEEWVGKRINSKNVIKVICHDKPRQFLYYVTEYVDGLNLRQWMDVHRQADIKEVREIVKQIASGLRAFHRLEMVHQDIKPENIMLDANGRAKVIDFGSTKIAGIQEIATPLERTTLLGTRNYTAPEYLVNQPGTSRSDIFSLGVITYELLTGKLPYGKALEKDLTSTQLSKLVYHPSYHYNAMIPIWLDKAIEKAVRVNPRLRYELLSEFITDISKPNSSFINERPLPLIEKNPVKFWQILTLLLIITNLVLIYFLHRY